MNRFSSSIRGTTVVLVSLISVFSILGGVGGICVAFAPQNWPPFRALAQMQWMYQATTLLTLAAGIAFAVIAYALLRGEKWAYPSALGLMAFQVATGLYRVQTSIRLRGSAAPTHVRVYLSVAVLAWLIFIRLPAIWNKVKMDTPLGGPSYNYPAGLACVAAGLGLFGYAWIAGPTHTVDGVNLVNLIRPQVNLMGSLLLASGAGFVLLARAGVHLDEVIARLARPRTKKAEGSI